jgi:hypothetical protein
MKTVSVLFQLKTTYLNRDLQAEVKEPESKLVKVGAGAVTNNFGSVTVILRKMFVSTS